MRRSRRGAARIVGILKQAEAGKRVGEPRREHGITDAAYQRK